MMNTRLRFIILGLATLGSLALTIYALFSINENVQTSSKELVSPVLEDRQVYSKEEMKDIASLLPEKTGFENVNAFIAANHAYYNQTTGFGEITNLNTNDQTDKAIEIVSYINFYANNEEKDLERDLQEIKSIALRYVENASQKDVQMLHRYFHDLDIGLNGYGAYDKVWGVTAVLGKGE